MPSISFVRFLVFIVFHVAQSSAFLVPVTLLPATTLRHNREALIQTSCSPYFHKQQYLIINQTKPPQLLAPKMADESQTMDSSSNAIIRKIGSTTSMVVAGTFFLVLAYQRDAFMLTFFIGSILNGISSKVLKRVLNQERPGGFEDEASVKYKPSDKGMPSSHAMSLGFIGTYCIFQTWNILGYGMTSIAIATALIAYATISLVYRVQTNLHTFDQIAAGLFFGITNSFLWHGLAFGENPVLPSVNLMELVSTHLLPESGIMPVKYLAIPAAVGLAVVGSIERRISSWWKKRKAKND